MSSSTVSTVTHRENGEPSIKTRCGSGSMKPEDLKVGDRVINITNYQPGEVVEINPHWGGSSSDTAETTTKSGTNSHTL
jgi:hypothetical protein